jgi:hypothetical protein
MIEIDPRLESKLRSKYERIEAEDPPLRLMTFDPEADRSRRRTLNLVAGAVGLAVIAAGAAVFAAELNGRHEAVAPAGRSTPASTPRPSPAVVPGSSMTVLIPVTYGTGTETLPTITVVPNKIVWVESGCYSTSARATLTIILNPPATGSELGQCVGWSARPGGGGAQTTSGGPTTVTVQADPSVRWVVAVFETPLGVYMPTDLSVSPYPIPASPAT